MCGIVGAVAKDNVVPILLEGLSRLEYRGYDSAGIVVANAELQRLRTTERVSELGRLVATKKPKDLPELHIHGGRRMVHLQKEMLTHIFQGKIKKLRLCTTVSSKIMRKSASALKRRLRVSIRYGY